MAAEHAFWRQGVVCIALLFFIATTDAQICSPHRSQSTGECIPAKNCPSVLNTFQPTGLATFIEQHGCGVEPNSGDVLVCCPRVIAASGGISSDEMRNNSFRNTSNCGSKQINGGALWPFVVGLGFVDPDQNLIALNCNGVLISTLWVLTHPSCFANFVITTAFFGIGRADSKSIVQVPVTITRIPTDYDSAKDINSVGLAKLAFPVTTSDDMQVVCLPPGPDYDPATQRFVLYIGRIDDGSVTGGFEVRSLWKHKVSLETCRTSPGIAVFPTHAHICTNGLHACNIPIARPLLVGLDTAGRGYTILGVGGLTADTCTSDVTSFTSVSKSLLYINRIVNPSNVEDQLSETASNLLQNLADIESVNTCGRRVLGGGVQMPFTVSLGKGHRTESNSGDQSTWTYTGFCTGVFLTPLWVLTDARCLQNNAVDHAVTGYQRGLELAKFAKVASIETPPSYTPSRDHNTVALVKLETPLEFTIDTQPVCLTRLSSYDNATALTAISAGYAFNRKAEVILETGLEPVVRVCNCACIASRYVTFDAQAGPYICTSSIKACTFFANPPIIVEPNENYGAYTVVGVGGENANFCRGDFLAYVRVRPHLPWIKSKVFPDGYPYHSDDPHLLATFKKSLIKILPIINRNTPNQPSGVISQSRGSTPGTDGIVVPNGVAANSGRPLAPNNQATFSTSSGISAFTEKSITSNSPNRFLVFPD